MNAMQLDRSRPVIALVVRWIARLGSLASIWILAGFLFGEFGHPTLGELVAIALFPVGVVAGMLLGWWREGLGGLVSVVSLGAFYLWVRVLQGHFPGGPYFLIFSAPGFLFLISSFLNASPTRR